MEAVKNGETAIGIKVKGGVVLAVEKKASSILIDETSYRKVQNLAGHIGATYAGLGPDFRVLTQKSRKESKKYWLKYMEPMYVSTLCRETATVVQEYTQSGKTCDRMNNILRWCQTFRCFRPCCWMR